MADNLTTTPAETTPAAPAAVAAPAVQPPAAPALPVVEKPAAAKAKASEKLVNENGERVFTQAEVDAMMVERVKRAQTEAERLAGLTAEERAAEERKKLEEELAEYRRKDAFANMAKEAGKILAANGFQANENVLSFVVAETAEQTKANTESFMQLVNGMVEAMVQSKLTGTAPAAGKPTVTAAATATTKADIMKIANREERQAAIAANPHLFNLT